MNNNLVQLWFRQLAVFMALVMTAVSLPLGEVHAGLIRTETALAADGVQIAATREQLSSLMARQDMQLKLRRLGIDPAEAAARVEALSDAEILRLAGQVSELPVGQDGSDFSQGFGIGPSLSCFSYTQLPGVHLL